VRPGGGRSARAPRTADLRGRGTVKVTAIFDPANDDDDDDGIYDLTITVSPEPPRQT
jgi:hypothetical protein